VSMAAPSSPRGYFVGNVVKAPLPSDPQQWAIHHYTRNMDSSMRGLESSKNKLQGELDVALTRVPEIQYENAQLRHQVDKLRRDAATIEQKLHVAESRHQAEMDELRRQWAQERSQMLDQHACEVRGLKGAITDRDLRIETLEAENNELATSMARQREETRTQVAALETQMAGLKEQLESYKTTVRAKEEELRCSEATRIELLADLQRVKEREDRALKQMKLEHARVTQAIYVQLEDEKDARRAEVAAIRAEAALCEAELTAKCNTKCEELESEKVEHAETRRQLAKLQGELEEAARQRRPLEDEIKHLQSEVERLLLQVDNEQRLRSPLEKELQDAKDTIRQLHTKILQLEDDKLCLTVKWKKALEAAHIMDRELSKALAQAQKVHKIDLEDLPAVYQVHNLQPLLQIKMDNALGDWLQMYASLQERLHEVFE